MADTVPEFIGKYKVTDIIAKGGMGIVYKAIHPSLKRYVVIKKMTARRSTSNLERFKREAQILLDLQNPCIVHLFDYFTEGGYRYMVEEFVDGMALDKLLQKQTYLSPQVSLLILQDACIALKYAHSKDIVHRDIKPGNILISKRADIKLADFGIASDSQEDESLTQNGVALGTPAYMPPEQFENSASVDKRADIYALGIMLYEMTTGSRPYPGTLTYETLNIIKKGKYIPPKKIDKNIPNIVCHLIKKMLKPKAHNRFQSVEHILKITRKYLKHYDTHAIRVQLSHLITEKGLKKEDPYIQKDLKIRKARSAVISIAATTLVIAFCWFQGWIHRFLLRPWFTPVKVEVAMTNASSAVLDLPVRAYFFENDGDTIPEVMNSRRVLYVPKKILWKNAKASKDSGEKNEGYKGLETKYVYLTPGEYRLKMVAGPYVWWKSFTVGKKTCVLNCHFLKDMSRSIKVIPSAFDAKTGADISSSVSVDVFYGGKWVSISEIPPEKILSNAVWRFKFSAQGYKDEIFSLRFDWYQDELYISANMSKIEH